MYKLFIDVQRRIKLNKLHPPFICRPQLIHIIFLIRGNAARRV